MSTGSLISGANEQGKQERKMEGEREISMSPRSLAALILALITGLSGGSIVTSLINKPVDSAVTDKLKEIQTEIKESRNEMRAIGDRVIRLETKLEEDSKDRDTKRR